MGDDLVGRLWNWGAWARADPGGPDGSCANPLYEQWVPHKAWDAAWGERVVDPGEERDPLDVDDAEAIDCWVRQLSFAPRVILVRRFVLRAKVGWRDVDPAVRALRDLMQRNREVVRRVADLRSRRVCVHKPDDKGVVNG